MSLNMSTAMFLLAIVSGSFAAASPSHNVIMMVDEPLTSSSGGMQYGHFLLPDGKEMTLSRPSRPGNLGCIELGQPCGALHWCCGTLVCNGTFKGKCIDRGCSKANEFCLQQNRYCCYPLLCTDIMKGGRCYSEDSL